MITLKEKLKAIKGSIEKWDKISKREEEDYGSDNCPLCQLYSQQLPGCPACPVHKKTGKPQCDGTPYSDYREALREESRMESLCWAVPSKNTQEAKDTTDKAARRFHDWLKDLYIEVSEAGGGAPEDEELEEDFIKRMDDLKIKRVSIEDMVETTFEVRVSELEERIRKLETSSGAIDLISETHKIRIEKLEKDIQQIKDDGIIFFKKHFYNQKTKEYETEWIK